jgi:hypothetical protein
MSILWKSSLKSSLGKGFGVPVHCYLSPALTPALEEGTLLRGVLE